MPRDPVESLERQLLAAVRKYAPKIRQIYDEIESDPRGADPQEADGQIDTMLARVIKELEKSGYVFMAENVETALREL